MREARDRPTDGDERRPPNQAEPLEVTGRTRPPTRGSACPCGSGLKYKKCCMTKDKADIRLARHKEKYGHSVELVKRSSSKSKAAVDEEKAEDNEFIGTF